MPCVLSHLSFAYPDRPHLFQDFTATVTPGDRIAVIGPNGAGKSTLLQLLAGTAIPTSGHIDHDLEPVLALMNPERADRSWGQSAWRQIRDRVVENPALLLLDEPTRHLDYDHRRQLAGWLTRLSGAIVVVSHDVDFLDAVATHTWHVAGGTIDQAALPPSLYLHLREEDAIAYERRWRQQQERIERLEEDIQGTKEQARHTERTTHDDKARRHAKKVANKAKARETRLEHWKASGEMLAAPHHAHVLRYTWDHVAVTPGVICRVEGGSLGYGQTVLDELYLTVRAGDRIGLMGDNGTGKSSLLAALLGRFSGQVVGYWRRPEGPVGYVEQVFDGDAGVSLWQYFQEHSALSEGLGRAWLQSYGFRSGQLDQAVEHLSQGEQVKLQVAAFSAAGVPVLALDELEHHLDWPSLEAIAEGLRRYPGTLVVISHQPRFLSQLGVTTRWVTGRGTVSVETVD